MRDIRWDLKERLASLEEQVTQLQASLRVIEDESTVIIRLLDYEDHRFSPEPEQTNAEQCDRPLVTDFNTKELNGRPMEAFAKSESSGNVFEGFASRGLDRVVLGSHD
jgi:hypothetical protein